MVPACVPRDGPPRTSAHTATVLGCTRSSAPCSGGSILCSGSCAWEGELRQPEPWGPKWREKQLPRGLALTLPPAWELPEGGRHLLPATSRHGICSGIPGFLVYRWGYFVSPTTSGSRTPSPFPGLPCCAGQIVGLAKDAVLGLQTPPVGRALSVPSGPPVRAASFPVATVRGRRAADGATRLGVWGQASRSSLRSFHVGLPLSAVPIPEMPSSAR